MNEIDKKGKSIKNLNINCGRGSHERYFPSFDFSKRKFQTNPQFIISHPEELPKRFHMILRYYHKGRTVYKEKEKKRFHRYCLLHNN